VNPGLSISTEKVYKRYDTKDIPPDAHPDTNLLIKALEKGDLHTFAKNMKNVLEYPVLENRYRVRELKTALASTDNVLGTLMSGSGSSVFALYATPSAAYLALNKFRKQHFFSVLIRMSP
jgi:4-diphosphocytidyl-2-C-methyl-D-erythritol kinase